MAKNGVKNDMSLENQFADLLAELRPTEGETSALIMSFAKADSEWRAQLINALHGFSEIEALTGMAPLQVLLDIVNNPTKYGSENVATVEKLIEELIAAAEEGLRGAISQGQSEVASLFSLLLRKLR
jgi:hypothetical protein